jgi:integrase/recombinase XerD
MELQRLEAVNGRIADLEAGIRVQRLLSAVDRSTPRGLRDYALLLMMTVYGLGAGEVIRLQFQDIDWEAATMSVLRPKTGVAFAVPLLPAVAHALASYLRHGRPIDTPTKSSVKSSEPAVAQGF